jgi:hypothetical protein
MLIIALVLALIGLVALVFAVVTSNELVAWVCIGASALGVVLLIVDALRERRHGDADEDQDEDQVDEDGSACEDAVDYPEDASDGPDEGADSTKEAAVPADRHGDESAK